MSIKIFFYLLILLVISACIPNSPVPEPEPKVLAQIVFSPDQINATLITDAQFTGIDSLMHIIRSPIPPDILLNWFNPATHETTEEFVNPLVISILNRNKAPYIIHRIEMRGYTRVFHFIADTATLRSEYNKLKDTFNPLNPIEPLFHRKGEVPHTLPMSTEPLVFPCDNLPIPKRASRLPNAPREYRFGIHRGIDFFSNWGTPVRSVSKGIVLRADKNYIEVPQVFREELLKKSQRLKRTPSDIFNSVLLGQAVFIDHGFDLFSGYRTITIYAHLSHIEPRIEPGYVIEAGEIFGLTGNSGTEQSTRGTRQGAHLHFELILQDAGGEYYYGQGIPFKILYPALVALFE